MNKKLYCKILTIEIIVLFIGVGIHPAFAVDTNTSTESIATDNDLIELPVQIHTSKGIQRHTLELTNQKVEELDKIFDKLKVDLWDCNSHYEVTEAYKEAIVSLSENGLLPDGLSVEEAQELVLKNTLSPRFGKIFSHMFKGLLAQRNVFNLFCSVSGNSTRTDIWQGLLRWISYGYTKYSFDDYPAYGWIHTSGLLFTQRREGSFYGRIMDWGFGAVGFWDWIGAIGFRGMIYSNNPARYLGKAYWVWVGNNKWG